MGTEITKMNLQHSPHFDVLTSTIQHNADEVQVIHTFHTNEFNVENEIPPLTKHFTLNGIASELARWESI